ncbi:MAG: hypothetical protein H6R00_4517 [Proteobacteria bacterium]|nr:hypothetical protein [Pseudomonadota bacterium]
MHVRIDEARQNDGAPGVDHFENRIAGGLGRQVGTNGGDTVGNHQDVTAIIFSTSSVVGENASVSDQKGHVCFLVKAWVRWVAARNLL